jgi:hypothetical protein
MSPKVTKARAQKRSFFHVSQWDEIFSGGVFFHFHEIFKLDNSESQPDVGLREILLCGARTPAL